MSALLGLAALVLVALPCSQGWGERLVPQSAQTSVVRATGERIEVSGVFWLKQKCMPMRNARS